MSYTNDKNFLDYLCREKVPFTFTKRGGHCLDSDTPANVYAYRLLRWWGEGNNISLVVQGFFYMDGKRQDRNIEVHKYNSIECIEFLDSCLEYNTKTGGLRRITIPTSA